MRYPIKQDAERCSKKQLRSSLEKALVGFLLVAGGTILHVDAYISSGSSVSKRRLVLEQMTSQIFHSRPGELTPEMLSKAPELLHAWARNPYSDSPAKHGLECAVTVERLVKRLIDEQKAGNSEAVPTTNDYNAMLEGWSRSGLGVASAERCEQILAEMQKDALIKPDLHSFKAVLLAWQQSNVNFAPLRAQRILQWMIKLNNDGENNAKPDADCFDIVLQTWAKSGRQDAPQHVEDVLICMERHSVFNKAAAPRTRSFNSALAAWNKSQQDGAAERAQDILRWMEIASTHGNSEVKPDIISYSTVMGAVINSGEGDSAKTAQSLLGKVEASYNQGNRSLCPDSTFFNQVINAWSKSRRKLAYKKARSVLNRQISLYEDDRVAKCRPDVFGFTSVIDACSRENSSRPEQRRAFKVALQTFNDLKDSPYGEPNHVTYGTLIKACANLLPPKQRNTWIRRIFKECVEKGYVGNMVVSTLRKHSPSIYKEVMVGMSKKNLPASWTKNIQGDGRGPRPRKSNRKSKARTLS